MIHEFRNPIPVVTPKGSGYAIYVRSNGTFENDEVCVAMDDGGQWFHFNTGQIKSWKNATYGINATPKESYTEEWLGKFYEGHSVPVTPFTNIGSITETRWTDELVSELAGVLYGKARGGEMNFMLHIKEFKEKHNIK